MAKQFKKESEGVSNQKISFPSLISQLVDIGGVGGLIKIGIAFIIWVLLLFQNNLNLLVWNTLILNIPCVVDVFEFKNVPNNIQTEKFQKFRGVLIVLLIISILFSLSVWGIQANIEKFNLDKAIIKGIFKFFCSLSVIGVGVVYIGKIYAEGFRLKQIENSNNS